MCTINSTRVSTNFSDPSKAWRDTIRGWPVTSQHGDTTRGWNTCKEIFKWHEIFNETFKRGNECKVSCSGAHQSKGHPLRIRVHPMRIRGHPTGHRGHTSWMRRTLKIVIFCCKMPLTLKKKNCKPHEVMASGVVRAPLTNDEVKENCFGVWPFWNNIKPFPHWGSLTTLHDDPMTRALHAGAHPVRHLKLQAHWAKDNIKPIL